MVNSARSTMTQKASQLFATGATVIPTHTNRIFYHAAKQITAAGEEVVVSYGSHSNDYLLVECELRNIHRPTINSPFQTASFL